MLKCRISISLSNTTSYLDLLTPALGMGDLEDKILKKNIPGKYTWWEKESDEEGEQARADWLDPDASDPEAELSELQKQQKWIENDCPEPVRRTIAARYEKERARTGVKGVLADYKAWKASAEAEDVVEGEYRKAMLQRMARGHRLEEVAQEGTMVGLSVEGGGDSSDDDNDDENFLQRYRERRLQQLKVSTGRPQFGQIREVERGDFVLAVDIEDPRTCVVVHLYEPYVAACVRMNRYLEVLACRKPLVKFLRMRSSAADGDYDPVALPTLLLYRNREVVGCVTRVTDDLGEFFTQEDVEWLLQEHDVFETLAGSGDKNNASLQGSIAKGSHRSDNEDNS